MPELILIVDDEADIANTLEFNLQRDGYRTLTALSGAAGLDLAAKEPLPDLILLDLMLPDISGTEVCRRLRANDKTRAIPVVMLTAKDDEIDRVVGFEIGADDYVTKPFSVRELTLRIKAILRRTDAAQPTSEDVRFGVLRIDIAGHRVWVDEAEITLTALEFRLLTTLHARKGRVQTRDTLLHDVWGMQASVTTRTVDTHVRRLRKKLGAASEYVETLRGVGYRFRAEPGERSGLSSDVLAVDDVDDDEG
jgi:two-component system phosphate regulon response regulator PhoB